ncbi:MAG: sulfotransferase [Rubrobacteraceae bacterium]
MNAPYRPRRPAELLSGTLFLDLGGDHRDTILVAGSGRSGTTWLSELINRENEYRFIFEPFHPGKVAPCEPFLRKQYLRPEDDRAIYLEAAGKILSGKIRSRWADRFNRKLLARRRLIKDIRANLLLGWTRRHFPETPIILLLRHPCAVADSRLRLGWRDNLDEMMSQRQLVEDHLEPLEADILAAKDPFERSIFLWCIENYIPLRQPGSEKLHIVFYENLLTDPESELASIFDFLRERPPEFRSADPPSIRRLAPPRTPGALYEDDPEERLRTEDAPSEGGSRIPGSEPRSEPKNPADRLRTGGYSPGGESETPDSPPGSEAWRISGWTERVDAARRKRAVEIMGLFGLDRIYGEDPMPRPEGVLEP